MDTDGHSGGQNLHLYAQTIHCQSVHEPLRCGEEQLGIDSRFGDALQDLIGDTSWRAAFIVRLGHPTEQAPPSSWLIFRWWRSAYTYWPPAQIQTGSCSVVCRCADRA